MIYIVQARAHSINCQFRANTFNNRVGTCCRQSVLLKADWTNIATRIHSSLILPVTKPTTQPERFVAIIMIHLQKSSDLCKHYVCWVWWVKKEPVYMQEKKKWNTTFCTFWYVRPTKTPIIMHICTVWSESSLFPWRNFAPLANQNAHSEDSDQTARMRRLTWSFAARTCQTVRFLTWRLPCLPPRKTQLTNN